MIAIAIAITNAIARALIIAAIMTAMATVWDAAILAAAEIVGRAIAAEICAITDLRLAANRADAIAAEILSAARATIQSQHGDLNFLL